MYHNADVCGSLCDQKHAVVAKTESKQTKMLQAHHPSHIDTKYEVEGQNNLLSADSERCLTRSEQTYIGIAYMFLVIFLNHSIIVGFSQLSSATKSREELI